MPQLTSDELDAIRRRASVSAPSDLAAVLDHVEALQRAYDREVAATDAAIDLLSDGQLDNCSLVELVRLRMAELHSWRETVNRSIMDAEARLLNEKGK